MLRDVAREAASFATDAAAAATVAIAVVLAVAGTLKLARPVTFIDTLRRIVPRRAWALRTA